MFEKYCHIKYRDCFLEVDEHNHSEPTKNHFFTAKSPSMGIYEGRSLVGRYPEVKTLISEFFRLIDRLLGEREKEHDKIDFLFCSVLYKGYELNIYHKTEESYYCAWIDGFDFAAWGEWSVNRFVSVIDAFRKKVDSGTGENLIHTFANYKGHNLEVRQEAEDSEWFVGTSKIGDKDWIEKGYRLTSLIRAFEYCVDLHLRDKELEQNSMYEYF